MRTVRCAGVDRAICHNGRMLRLGLLAGVGVAVWLGVAVEARACSCAGEWNLVVPSSEHPENAPLVFETTCAGSFEGWSVTVDGDAADFGAPSIYGDVSTLQIMPTPAIGAEIVVMVDCAQRLDDTACGEEDGVVERARFAIGAADTVAPPPAVDVTFAILEPDQGGCFDLEDHGTLEAEVEIDDREPGTWVELVVSRADGNGIASTGRLMPEDGDLMAIFYAADEALAFPEICVEAIVHDAAGNLSAGAKDCRVEDTNEDDGPLEGRGCSCTSAPARSWEAALLGLLVFGLRRRHPVTPKTSRV
jgi:MYXO-CTERM domain-containing protein